MALWVKKAVVAGVLVDCEVRINVCDWKGRVRARAVRDLVEAMLSGVE